MKKINDIHVIAILCQITVLFMMLVIPKENMFNSIACTYMLGTAVILIKHQINDNARELK